MLAFEKMGSSHHFPFGYSFTSPTDLPDFAALNQSSLLNDQESQWLNSVFDNPPDPLDASAPFLAGPSGKDQLADYQWAFTEPPPNFVGVSSAVATAPPAHSFPDASFLEEPQTTAPLNDGINASISQDLLGPGADLVDLLNNRRSHGHAHRHSLSSYPAAEAVMNFGGLHSSEALNNLRTITAPPVSRIISPPAESASTTPHGDDQPLISGLWIHGSEHNASQQQLPESDSDARRYYRFGSDGNFAGNRFIPSSDHDTDKAATQRILGDWYGALVPDTSADNTQPPSPTSTRLPRRPHSNPLHRTSGQVMNGISDNESSDEDGDRPRKRRRSVYPDDDPASPTNKGHSRRLSSQIRTKARRISTTSNHSPSSRPRKESPSSASKAPREHLSEEQKRSNHILSEQKRRNLIKQGFEELHSMVPELRSGGFSKSNVLVEAVNYLEELMRGNDMLKAMVGEATG